MTKGLRTFAVAACLSLLAGGLCLPAAMPQESAPPTALTPEEREMARLMQESGQANGKRDYVTAERLLQQGLEIAERSGNLRWQGRFLHTLGALVGRRERIQQAKDYLLRAKAIRDEIGDVKERAETLNNLGRTYEQLGLFADAIETLKQALALKETLDDSRSLYTTLNNLAIACSRYGQYDEGLRYFERAQSLDHVQNNPGEQAVLLNNMGNVRMAKGQFDTALDLLSRSIAIQERAGNTLRVADSLNNIGNVYYLLGQFEKAHSYYQQALTLREKGARSRDIATSLFSLGDSHMAQRHYPEAIEHHQRALAIRQELGVMQEIAESLNSLGVVHQRSGKLQEALRFFTEALALKEKAGEERGIITTLQNLGGLYIELGQLDRGQSLLEEARTRAERLGNRQDIASIYNELASLHFLAGRLDRAEAACAKALANFESITEQVGDPAQLGALQDLSGRLYARYAAILLRRKRPEEALVMLERGRGQGLVRKAAQNQELAVLLSAEDAAQWETANRDVSAAIRLLNAARDREQQAIPEEKSAAQTQTANALKRFQEAERRLTILQTTLYRQYPDFRRLRGAEPPTITRLRALAERSPDTLFLEWGMVSDKATLLFALTKQSGLHAFRLPVGDKTLARLVAQWRDYLTAPADPKKDKAAAIAGEEKAARTLHGLLLGPLMKKGLLAPGRYARVVAVADGPLLDIPYVALMDDKGKRLLETHALSAAVSLGALTWPANSRKPSASLLCFADPNGDGSEILLSASRGKFGPLPAARRETRTLVEHFPGALGKFGKEAQEKEFKRLAGTYALFHFATHGAYDGQDGRRSFLVLAPGAGEDGFLEAREIMGLKITAQLVTLSACETAQGQKSGGEGVLGLAWAFRAAGCPSVVASQWKVDDAATGRLMTQFYEELKRGKRKDDALRTAMLEVRKEPFRSPAYYWAAFQVIGNTAPVTVSRR